MKYGMILTLISLACILQAQHLDIEGDTRIEGKINIINAIGDSSVFIGANAGMNHNGLNLNTFVGHNSGRSNINGGDNSFFGSHSGSSNTFGGLNSFFGYKAGALNKTGSGNSFYGNKSGSINTSGSENSFFGNKAGLSNTTGHSNTMVGSLVSIQNTSGAYNTFVGNWSGNVNEVGAYNTMLGAYADVTRDSLVLAIAIGSKAQVDCSNCAVIGGIDSDAVKVGIGLTSPTQELSIRDVDNSGRATINLEEGGNALDLSIGSTGGILNSSGELQLDVDNTGILFLQSDRKVGIGTGVPAADLHISAGNTNTVIGNPGCTTNTFAGIGFQSTLDCTNYALLGNATQTLVNVPAGGSLGLRVGNQNHLSISSTGKVRIHTLGSAGSTQLCLNANNELAPCSSSERYKHHVQAYTPASGFLHAFRPVSYQWKESDLADIGLIAEEVAQIDPRLVTYTDEGRIEGVKYDRLGVILLGVVREQENRIEVLEQLVHRLAKTK